MSSLSSYLTIRNFLTTAVATMSGMDNAEVYYGDKAILNNRPSVLIRPAEAIESILGFSDNFSSISRISLTIESVWMAEGDFLGAVEDVIDYINANGRGVCDIDALFVASVNWSYEAQNLARAELVIEARYQHQ